MISVTEAEQIILKNLICFPVVSIPLEKAYGAILREDIFADRDLPPFNKALMDGIAIKSDAFVKGTHQFTIEGIQPAGQKQSALKSDQGCIEIMTGAVLPKGCDAVIPIEGVEIKNNKAFIKNDVEIKKGQSIQPQGWEHKKGERLLQFGDLLNPVRIGIAANVGKSKLKVSYKPRVAIISTGDELVNINAKIKPFQIRKSNSYALQAAFTKTNLFETGLFHINDDKIALRKKLAQILKKFDVLVLSGGVSMGKFDFIPEVMKELGVKVVFHKVAQRPGKPFWFGKYKNRKLVFALPGNPVSTLVCAYRYAIPQLKRALGVSEQQSHAILNHDCSASSKLTSFMPVTIIKEHGQLNAHPVSIAGSGDFAHLSQSDGFVELPIGKNEYKKGSIVKLFLW